MPFNLSLILDDDFTLWIIQRINFAWHSTREEIVSFWLHSRWCEHSFGCHFVRQNRHTTKKCANTILTTLTHHNQISLISCGFFVSSNEIDFFFSRLLLSLTFRLVYVLACMRVCVLVSVILWEFIKNFFFVSWVCDFSFGFVFTVSVVAHNKNI